MAPTQKAAAKKAATIVEELEFSKSTKGTHVYQAKDENAAVPTLYIRKTGMDNGTPPDEITLTIDFKP